MTNRQADTTTRACAFRTLIGVLLCTLILAACAEDDEVTDEPEDEPNDAVAEEAGWDADGGEEWEELLVEAEEEGGPTVAGPGFLGDPLAEAFEADTGIPMDYLGGSTRELNSRLDEEARAGNVTIDVAFGGGTQLNTLKPEGLLEPIAPQLVLPATTDPAGWVYDGPKWLDEEEQYMLQGSEWVHGWVVVNADEVDVDEIRVWDDLLDPELEGRIAAYDPRTGGQGQSAAAFILEHLGEDYVVDLFEGQDVQYTQDGSQLVEWVARGTADVALGAIAPDVESFVEQGINLEVVLMEDGPGTLTGGFSVLKQPVGNPNPASAAVFNNWYASGQGLEVYGDVLLEPPLREDHDVDVPEYLVPDPDTEYIDQYVEEWYVDVRPEVNERLVELLGE